MRIFNIFLPTHDLIKNVSIVKNPRETYPYNVFTFKFRNISIHSITQGNLLVSITHETS